MQVKLGICLAHIGLLAEALKQLEILFQDPVEQDLCLDAADTLLQHQHFAEVKACYVKEESLRDSFKLFVYRFNSHALKSVQHPYGTAILAYFIR